MAGQSLIHNLHFLCPGPTFASLSVPGSYITRMQGQLPCPGAGERAERSGAAKGWDVRGNRQERIGVVVLGSTGTIGRLTLEVAERHSSRIRVIGLSARQNASLLGRQAAVHAPEAVALADADAAGAFEREVAGRWQGELLTGEEGSCRLATWPMADVVVNGIVGAAGLAPSLAALEAGRRLALANKESLVMAGNLVREARDRSGGELIPVDSEHSAILQCLAGRGADKVRRILLTASGGPFRGYSLEALAKVTPEEALRHPTWRMGPRITIDSATLFNKGMELIEARWLFDLPMERIEVWIHPQSVVHGLVEMLDGSLIAQLSRPDMHLPIQLAISYPQRWDQAVETCNLAAMGPLEFEPPDEASFPCLGLAREAARLGGTAPAVANAADEILVGAFLAGKIPFPAIPEGLRAVLKKHVPIQEPVLEQILAADRWARREAEGCLPGSGSRQRGGRG